MPDTHLIWQEEDRRQLLSMAFEVEQIGIRNQDVLLDAKDDEYADAYTALMMAVQAMRDLAGTTVPCWECAGASPMEGVRWPVNMNGDETKPWVERCDSCEKYDSDESAAAALAQQIDGLIGYATVFGLEGQRPYVLARSQVTS